MSHLQELKNGSDIRGIAISTETERANLTAAEAKKIAMGMVKWLALDKGLATSLSNGQLTVAIGHDSRLSADDLKQAMIDGFTSLGVKVIDVSLATTPAMFMATQFAEYQCDAAVMITASHLPYYFNGIKIFTREGGAEHEDIDAIVTYAEMEQDKSVNKGTVEQRELIPLYAADLVAKIRQGIPGDDLEPLKGFHIIVDAGNGAGGYFAKQVLEVLGADTTGSQFLEPDGRFPNHMPNPDNQEAMTSIQEAVLAVKADLGVIFDTDVDRAAVVDQAGNVLNRNNLIAVLAKIVFDEYPGTTIVTNSPTSSHLKVFIESLGGKQSRYISGYRNVINRAIQLNQEGVQTELAIETSGHAAFKENYFLDDGAYVIAKILMLLPKLQQSGQSLGELISHLKQPVEAQEVRFKIADADYRAYGEKVIQEMADFMLETPGLSLDPENEEGIRSDVKGEMGSGWFLLRMSLHEPLLVLQVENDQAGKNHVVFETLRHFFERYEGLDRSALDKVFA